MTRYEQGFMNKCAEYGVPADQALHLLEKSGGTGMGLIPTAATDPGRRSLIGAGLKNIGSGVVNRLREGGQAIFDFGYDPRLMITDPWRGAIYNKGWAPSAKQIGTGFRQIGRGLFSRNYDPGVKSVSTSRSNFDAVKPRDFAMPRGH